MAQSVGFAVFLLFGTAYCVACIAWFTALSYLFKTVANRHPGVRLWSAELGYLPFNIVFRPDLLTDRGQLARQRFGRWLLVFLGSLAAGLALSALARILP
jgi:hypothetical protein